MGSVEKRPVFYGLAVLHPPANGDLEIDEDRVDAIPLAP